MVTFSGTRWPLQGALDLTGGALGKALLTAVSLAGLAVVALVLLITEPSASPAAARLEALAGLEGRGASAWQHLQGAASKNAASRFHRSGNANAEGLFKFVSLTAHLIHAAAPCKAVLQDTAGPFQWAKLEGDLKP
jgi:hypothetical protein